MNLDHCRATIEQTFTAFTGTEAERRELGLYLADRSRELIGVDGARPVLRCRIRRTIPSQNKQTWAHWSAYRAEKKRWKLLMRTVLVPQAKPPTEPVYFHIISYRQQLLDFANLVGGAKPIPDCLQELNYLKDDSPRWCRIDYFQHTVPKSDERTELVFFQ